MTPTTDNSNSPAAKVVSTAAALVIVIAGIHAAQAIVVPFLLSIFIAVIISAILSWLRKRNIHTGAAIIILLAAIGVIGTVMVSVVGASANELMRKLPEINAAVQKTESQLRNWLDKYGLSQVRENTQEKPKSQSLKISFPDLPSSPEEETGKSPSTNPEAKSKNKNTPAEKSIASAANTTEKRQETSKAGDSEQQPLQKKMTPDKAEAASKPDSHEADSDDKTKNAAADSESIKLPEPAEPENKTNSSGNEQAETEADLLQTPIPGRQQFPEYIYGPRNYTLELLPSGTANPNLQSSGYLGGFSPVVIFRSFLDSVMGMFNYALIVFLMLVFLLLEWTRFGQRMEALPGNTQKNIEQVAEILASIRRYMLIKTMVSLLTGLLITIWLMLLGVKYAALWGTVAFLFNFIPAIGSLIAGIVPTLFVLVDQNSMMAVNVAIAFIVVNFLIGNLLEPRIMGEGLGISTFVVFLSLVFWGWVLGPAGMLLAVPITMVIKIALASDERSKWIAILIGSGIPGASK